MTIDNPVIVKCPDCHTIFKRIVYSSYTVFSGTGYSDGYRYPSTLSAPVDLPVFYCRRCNQWKSLSDAVDLFEVPLAYIEEDTILQIPESYLEKEKLEEALRQSWPAEIETELRFHLLWKQNHLRRGTDDRSPAAGNLKENLERLSRLIDKSEAPFMAAEIFRELGNFTEAENILQVLDENDDDRIPLFREQLKKKMITPFYIVYPKTGGSPYNGSQGNYEVTPEFLSSFRLFPPAEDVLAFPTMKARADYGDPPFLVRYPLEGGDGSVWIPCLGKKNDSAMIRFNRAFRPGEWRKFEEKATPRWKEALEWFWSRSSDEMTDKDDEEADRYYRILYQIYYNQCFFDSDESLEPVDESGLFGFFFDGMYDRFEARNDYYRTYWDLFWQDRLGMINFHPETYDLDAERRRRDAEKERIRQLRERAKWGLKDWQGGKDPQWFQSGGRTPVNDKGKLEFVGQIWLDYINAGTTLVYIFYDPEFQVVEQIFDYD